MKPRSLGRCSCPDPCRPRKTLRTGRARAATQPRARPSFVPFFIVVGGSGSVKIRAEPFELGQEVLVTAVDNVDAGHPRGAGGGQGGDEVAEAAAQIRNVDL